MIKDIEEITLSTFVQPLPIIIIIIMKVSPNAYISTVLVFLLVVALLFSSSRSVVDADDEHTGTKWNIDDVVVSSDGNNLVNNQFSFSYGDIDPTLSTSMMFGGIYDGDCWSPSATSYGKTGIDNETSELFTSLGLARSTKAGTAVIFSFTADTSEIAKNPALFDDSNLSANGNGSGKMTFCVRFALFDVDGSIKNYQESVISLNVKALTETKMTSNHLYKVEAALCDDMTPPFQQGESISICITPDIFASGAGIVISSIDEFTWIRDDENISQQAIKSANTVSDNGLTAITSTSGTNYRFESMLFATFYATDGSATGKGSVTLSFPPSPSDKDGVPMKSKAIFSVNLDGISKSKKQKVIYSDPVIIEQDL